MNAELLKKQQEALFQIETLPREPRKKNFSIACRVANNNMEAYVKIIAVGDDCDVTEFDVVAKLYKEGIRVNINYDKISEAVAEKRINAEFLAASGFLPEKGADAYVEHKTSLDEFTTAEMAKNFPGQRIKSGVPVELDEVIAEKHPATPGTIGLTVKGRKLEPEPGKDVAFELGENVAISQDGLKLLAAMPGVAGLSQGKIEVRDTDYDDWKYKVQFRNNNLEAVLSIIPGITLQPEHNKEWYEALLESHGIKFGAESEVYKRLPSKIKSTIVVKIAAGEPPVPGSNAGIIEHYKTGVKAGAHFFAVKSGQLIVEKTLVGKGTKGRNVFDEAVAAPAGTDVELSGGTNTNLSEDKLKLFSNIDGYVSKEKDAYCVVECLEIDPKAGSVPDRTDYPGMVRVLGDLPPGKSIIAGHHVEILGGINKSEVIAGGILKVKGMISDCVATKVQSGDDMIVSGVERSRLIGAKNIYVGGLVRASELIAGNGVYKHGGGKLGMVGGRVIALRDFDGDDLGATTPARTSIEVGMQYAMRVRYEHAGREIADTMNKYQLAGAELTRLAQMAKAGKITKEEIEKLKKMNLLRNILGEKVKMMTAGITKMQNAIAPTARNSKVKIRGSAYPGVVVKIGPQIMRVESRMDKVAFELEEKSKSIRVNKI